MCMCRSAEIVSRSRQRGAAARSPAGAEVGVDPFDPLGDGGERPLAGGPARPSSDWRARSSASSSSLAAAAAARAGWSIANPRPGASRSSDPSASGATTAHPHARASQASDGSPPSLATNTSAPARTAARPSASSGLVACTRPRAWAGTNGRSGRRLRRFHSSDELEAGRRGDELDERAQDGAALAVPFDRDRRPVLVARHERRADALGDDRVVARVDLGRLLGGLRRGGEQRVDARPVALERARPDGVVQRPVGRMERGDGQARRVPQRRRGHPGQDRLERVDDVESALAHRQGDVGAGADGDAGSAPPAALAQRHRRARRPPGAARRRVRSAPRHRRRRVPAAGAGRCAAPVSRSSVRAP